MPRVTSACRVGAHASSLFAACEPETGPVVWGDEKARATLPRRPETRQLSIWWSLQARKACWAWGKLHSAGWRQGSASAGLYGRPHGAGWQTPPADAVARNAETATSRCSVTKGLATVKVRKSATPFTHKTSADPAAYFTPADRSRVEQE